MKGIKRYIANVFYTIVFFSICIYLFSEEFPTLKDKITFIIAMVVIEVAVELAYDLWKKYKKQ